jgi:hypothetical protein
VAYIEQGHGGKVLAKSMSTAVTWCPPPPPGSVSLQADRTSLDIGQTATLTATASGLVDDTGYAVDLVDGADHLVARCGTGTQCSAHVTRATPTTVTYRAYIEKGTLTGIHAKSGPSIITWLRPPPTSVTLTASQTSVSILTKVQLTATASSTVSGTGYALDIVDNTNTRVLHCISGATCSGLVFSSLVVKRTYRAYVEKGTLSGIYAQSSPISVTWSLPPPPAIASFTCNDFGTDCVVFGAALGDHVTLTSTATGRVDLTQYVIDIWDETDNTLLSRCSFGDQCTANTVRNDLNEVDITYQTCIETPDRSSQASCKAFTVHWYIS